MVAREDEGEGTKARSCSSTMRVLIFALGLLASAGLVCGVAIQQQHQQQHQRAVDAVGDYPTVQLDYATYQGTTFADGVSQWLGLRYAAPPVGNLRFASPRDPPQQHGTQSANKHGPICIATGSGISDTQSEDCLFLDVYAPSTATPKSKLPVFFYIQGGGFNGNTNPNYHGGGLIKASGHDIVVVTFNYRVGVYGFLAGQEVEAGGSLNNGLKDQIKALKWVQKYIQKFGGDPDRVTVGGSSAGAASITLLLTAHSGRNDNLFHATAAESQSFGSMYNISESQFMYDGLSERTGCSSAKDSLQCLRNIDLSTLQSNAITTALPGAKGPPLYMYSPTIDGDLVPDYTHRLIEQGKFIRVPTIWGDDTNGGTVFTPKSTDSYDASDTFLHNNFPSLTTTQLEKLHELYPVDGTPSFPNSGRYWRQVSNAYGDMRYTCPGLFVSSAFAAAGQKTWNYLWDVRDPAQMAQGLGVPHTAEVNAIFGPENVNGGAPASYSTSNKAIVPVVQAYWTSFVRSGDVNEHRRKGDPEWEAWGGQGRRLVFRTNETAMRGLEGPLVERCLWLSGIAVAIRQ